MSIESEVVQLMGCCAVFGRIYVEKKRREWTRCQSSCRGVGRRRLNRNCLANDTNTRKRVVVNHGSGGPKTLISASVSGVGKRQMAYTRRGRIEPGHTKSRKRGEKPGGAERTGVKLTEGG
jgi:hypothetical protein